MDKRCLFLTSCGLTDETKKIFFESLKKETNNLRILFIPTAGIESDGARAGIALCLDELAKMGISHDNIFIYNLDDGLHIISNPIIPHWSEERENDISDEYVDIHLVDGQMVLINSGEIEIVG